MSRVTAALPIVGAFVVAVAAAGVLTTMVARYDPGPPQLRPAPRPEPMAEWERQVLVASATDGEQIYQQGQNNVPGCATCHGGTGIPAPNAPFPRLAGQSPEYVAKQLNDYASSVRNNEQMTPIARALNGPQRASVARYVSTLKPPETPLSATALNERGRTLDEIGDNALAVPGCGNCHGLRGRGEGVMLPPLAGQPQAYLVSQLNAFRTQRRQNDTVAVMEGIASRLSPEDIDALARYFSALHPVRAAGSAQ
jgi:cytochrome c553